MRSEERRKYILRKANTEGFVSIPKAAEHLGVSVETVRRDVTALEKEGILKKKHGGAAPIKLPLRKDAEYTRRIQSNQREKIAIGAEAAAMIRNDTVVALDCGVSVQAAAKCISGVENVTFVTNSLPIASILTDKAENGELSGRIIFIGGETDIKNRFTVGAETVNSLRKYHFDLALISCTAVSAEGASSYSLNECGYSAQIIANSARSVLVAESVKLGKNSVCRFASLTDFDRIITDDTLPVPTDMEQLIEKKETKLIIVHCPEADA